MLRKIKIEGLFNRFNYCIELKKDGITILTGPNGFGKSTILKIIQDYSIGDITQITLHKYKSIQMSFEKNIVHKIVFTDDFIRLNDKINVKREAFIALVTEGTQRRLPPYFERISQNEFIDMRTKETVKLGKIFASDNVTAFYNYDSISKDDMDILWNIIEDIKTKLGGVKFIGAQRLIAEVPERDDRKYYREITMKAIRVIKDIPEKLKIEISKVASEHSSLSNELDSTFPNRLFSEKTGLSKDEYDEISKEVASNQDSLKKYGLTGTKDWSSLKFNTKFAEALKIHFNDSKQKYLVFEKLVKKMDTFETIINGMLNNKKIKLSKSSGMEIIDIVEATVLELDNLSSGEQEIIVLFYQLIFESKERILLIDEPEISLHIAWQMELLKDFRKIVDISEHKLELIIATHSPQIINNNWDIQIDLNEINNA